MKRIKTMVTEKMVVLAAAYGAKNGKEDVAVEIDEGRNSYQLVFKAVNEDGCGNMHLTDDDGNVLMSIRSSVCNNVTKIIKTIADYIEMENQD